MATSSKEIIQTDEIFTGAKKAGVTLLCYIDYESAACALLNEILNQLLTIYPADVRVAIRHFPMAAKHQKAMKAAEAVIAAMQEGLLWPMNNILFQNQKKLGIISLKQYAKEIGTTNKRFLDQVINGVYAWQVREDLIGGVNKGVKTAPAVYINEKLFEEEITLQALSIAIQKIIG